MPELFDAFRPVPDLPLFDQLAVLTKDTNLMGVGRPIDPYVVPVLHSDLLWFARWPATTILTPVLALAAQLPTGGAS